MLAAFSFSCSLCLSVSLFLFLSWIYSNPQNKRGFGNIFQSQAHKVVDDDDVAVRTQTRTCAIRGQNFFGWSLRLERKSTNCSPMELKLRSLTCFMSFVPPFPSFWNVRGCGVAWCCNLGKKSIFYFEMYSGIFPPPPLLGFGKSTFSLSHTHTKFDLRWTIEIKYQTDPVEMSPVAWNGQYEKSATNNETRTAFFEHCRPCRDKEKHTIPFIIEFSLYL